jgi:hypothetical protein
MSQWQDVLPAEMRQEVRVRCDKSRRLMLAMTCRDEWYPYQEQQRRERRETAARRAVYWPGKEEEDLWDFSYDNSSMQILFDMLERRYVSLFDWVINTLQWRRALLVLDNNRKADEWWYELVEHLVTWGGIVRIMRLPLLSGSLQWRQGYWCSVACAAARARNQPLVELAYQMCIQEGNDTFLEDIAFGIGQGGDIGVYDTMFDLVNVIDRYALDKRRGFLWTVLDEAVDHDRGDLVAYALTPALSKHRCVLSVYGAEEGRRRVSLPLFQNARRGRHTRVLSRMIDTKDWFPNVGTYTALLHQFLIGEPPVFASSDNALTELEFLETQVLPRCWDQAGYANQPLLLWHYIMSAPSPWRALVCVGATRLTWLNARHAVSLVTVPFRYDERLKRFLVSLPGYWDDLQHVLLWLQNHGFLPPAFLADAVQHMLTLRVDKYTALRLRNVFGSLDDAPQSLAQL